MILPEFASVGLTRVAFGVLGGDVAECRIDALPIVVALGAGEQVAAGFVSGRPSPLSDEFNLEGVEKALHGDVVVSPSPSGSWATAPSCRRVVCDRPRRRIGCRDPSYR
jgi:hypothetical protein